MNDNFTEDEFTTYSDEKLAGLCAKGIDVAERELLGRYMQPIYWLPRRLFGAPEEDLSGFLIFAIEKIRERDILGKFLRDKGVKFSTWMGVVIRNLYMDYLRTLPENLEGSELIEESVAAPKERRERERPELLDMMQVRCKVLFKMLLCDTLYLEPEDIEWISSESGRGVAETASEIAKLEDRLRESETKLQERYDKLSRAYYWKSRYERQLLRLEKGAHRPHTTYNKDVDVLERKLERRRKEYENVAEELSGSGGIVTAPYRELAALLNVSEGTLASNISRCRSGAADLLRKLRT